MKQGLRILLVEDEPNVSGFLKKGLEELDYAVTVAEDGLSGINLAREGRYDLIILDVLLPKISGLDVCRIIREDDSKVPILMLTALGTTENKVLGLETGADDYLVKPFHFRELLARVRALTRRHSEMEEREVLKIGDLELDRKAKTVKRNLQPIKLTAREFMLLELLMLNRGKVLSRGEIAEKVWDVSFDTGTNVVDVYINYLRNKIDKNFDNKLIHTIIGMGYVMREDAGK